jgi:hypothetical protein
MENAVRGLGFSALDQYQGLWLARGLLFDFLISLFT